MGHKLRRALKGSHLGAAAGSGSTWETGTKAPGCNISPPCKLIQKSRQAAYYIKSHRWKKKERNKDPATVISATFPSLSPKENDVAEMERENALLLEEN